MASGKGVIIWGPELGGIVGLVLRFCDLEGRDDLGIRLRQCM